MTARYLMSTPTVAQALQTFYDKHQYGEEGGIHERFAWIRFGPVSLPFPNVPGRRNHVYLHDIHHLVTGYGVTWKGESAVSAWEVASGGWGRVYVIGLMAVWAMGLGMVLYPRSTVQAFRRGLTMRNALTCGLTKAAMYGMTVEELRVAMSRPPHRRRSMTGWAIISVLFFGLPAILSILLAFLLT